MVRWICPECGREWSNREPCCWVCEQDDPPLGPLCSIAAPPLSDEPVSIIAYGGVPGARRNRPAPVVAGLISDIDRQQWATLAALSQVQAERVEVVEPAAEELSEPALVPGPRPEPDPLPAPQPQALPGAEPVDEPAEDIEPVKIPVSEDLVTALVPDDTPPRIVPNWVVSTGLVLMLIAGLCVLVYLLFHTHLFGPGDHPKEPAVQAPGVVLLLR